MIANPRRGMRVRLHYPPPHRYQEVNGDAGEVLVGHWLGQLCLVLLDRGQIVVIPRANLVKENET